MAQNEEPMLQYPPLPSADFGSPPVFSRVIVLFPGREVAPLHCALELLDIQNEHLPYEALSYVWGTEIDEKPLWCNEVPLRITLNLAQALRRLRYPGEGQYRRLWVDAVCINQRDDQERARQVGYMRLVYKHAARTIIWLGQRDHETAEAVRFTRELGELYADLMAEVMRANAQELTQNIIAQRETIQEIMVDKFRNNVEGAAAIDRLLQRPYFERVWCIQEATVSKYCSCRIEDEEVDFQLLLFLIDLVLEWRGIDPTNPSPLQLWQTIRVQRLQPQEYQNRPAPKDSLGRMLVILMIIRNFKSTDPRDRIFATLGVTDEGLEPVLGLTEVLGNVDARGITLLQRGTIRLANRINKFGGGVDVARHPALKPDYSKSTRDVYRDFTRYCLSRSPQVLDILAHVQHHGDPDPADEFPSWVPRFDEPRLVSFFLPTPYRAGIPIRGRYRYYAVVHDNPLRPDNPFRSGVQLPNLLQLDGWRVDEVEAITEPVALKAYDEFFPDILFSQLYNFPLFPRPSEHYNPQFHDERLDVAFLLTLVLGGLAMVGYALNQHPETVDSTSWLNTIDQGEQLARFDILAWLRDQHGVDELQYADLLEHSQTSIRPGNAIIFKKLASNYCVNRRVYRTRTGVLGLGPKIMRPGDTVVVLFGGHYPFILRRRNQNWILLGDTYLRHRTIQIGEDTARMREAAGRGRVETFRLC